MWVGADAGWCRAQVPYAEPMWLTPGFKRSPYYKESHYKVQQSGFRAVRWATSLTDPTRLSALRRTVVRKFVDDHVYVDAQAKEDSGKRPAQNILDMMACVRRRQRF